MESANRLPKLMLYWGFVLLLLGTVSCRPSADEAPPPPIDELSQLFYADTHLFEGEGIVNYAFSPDHNWVLIHGHVLVPTHAPKPPYETLEMGFVLYRWPSLEEHWRWLYNESEPHLLYNIYWTPTSDAIWLSWLVNENHHLTSIELEGDSVRQTAVNKGVIDFDFSADGTQLVGFGGYTASGSSEATDFTPRHLNHLYLYDVDGNELTLKQELVLPDDVMVTSVYWPTGKNWVWVSQIEAPCANRFGPITEAANLRPFPRKCTTNPRSLYRWSLETNHYELHWQDFAKDTQPANMFQPDTGYLVTRAGTGWQVLDLAQRCPVLKWESSMWFPSWYDATTLSYVRYRGYADSSFVGGYVIKPLAEGEKLSCLP